MKSNYIDLICILILSFLSIIYVTTCLLIAKIKLHYTGQWLILLIGVEVGLVAFFATLGLKTIVAGAISVSPDTIKRIQIAELALEALFECSINTVHWVFALKYWSVARRM